MKKTFLVTGAHGFIGAWVTKRLISRGESPVLFDRSPDPKRLRLIMDDDELSQASFEAGDITDPAVLPEIVERRGITNIIHLAGLQVPSCRANPRAGAMVNIIGTLNVFDAAIASKGQIKQIAYASSAAVFGNADDGSPQTEAQAGNPGSHYGAYKRCNEDNARIFHLENGINSIGLRPLTVYGVGRDFGVTSDPTKAMKAAVVGRPFVIRFGGKTDFLFAADCADAFIRSAEADVSGAYAFNLHGETAAISSIIKSIEEVLPGASGLISNTGNLMPTPAELDDTAIVTTLGNIPHTPLATGIRSTIERFTQLQSEGRLDLSDLDQ